jgi:hypothetical protein
MTKFRFVLLGFFSMILTSLDSHAVTTFRYRTLVPNSADCANRSTEIAKSLNRQTGVQIISATCLPRDPNEPSDNQVAIILYSGARELVPSVTSIGYESDLVGGVTAGSYGGAYASQADCEADLQNQNTRLLTDAGAQVVNSYCEIDQSYTDWVAKLETVQALTKSLKAFMMSYGEPTPETELSMAAFVEAQGIHPARVFGKYVFYYDSPEKSGKHASFDVATNLLGTFADHAECDSQRTSFESIFKSVSPKVSSLVVCTDGTASFLEVLTNHRIHLRTQFTNDAYGSMTECSQDLDRVLRNIKTPRSTPAGGVCSYLASNTSLPYGITIFLK